MKTRPGISRTTFALAFILTIVVGITVHWAIGAVAQQGTYMLSDFEIKYPYDTAPDSGVKAAVTFVADWQSGQFPGSANCELTLTGEDGKEVGSLTFDLVSGTDGARTGPMIVLVSGHPSAGSGSCDDVANERGDGAGYVFRGPTKVEAAVDAIERQEIPNLAQVEFDVSWAEPGVNPGMRSCYLLVSRTDGSDETPVKYNVLAGEGTITFDVPADPEMIASAVVTCGPFEP